MRQLPARAYLRLISVWKIKNISAHNYKELFYTPRKFMMVNKLDALKVEYSDAYSNPISFPCPFDCSFPLPRYGASASSVGNKIIIHGGMNRDVLYTTWIYDSGAT